MSLPRRTFQMLEQRLSLFLVGNSVMPSYSLRLARVTIQFSIDNPDLFELTERAVASKLYVLWFKQGYPYQYHPSCTAAARWIYNNRVLLILSQT